MTDVTTDAVELAAAAIWALELHQVECDICGEMIAGWLARLEASMGAAAASALAPCDDETPTELEGVA